MPKTLRTSAVAGVVAVLALSLLSVAPTSAAARPGHDRGLTHARAVAALDAVRDALAQKPVDGAPRPDLTLLLRDLRLAMPALTTSERASAGSLLGLTIPPPQSQCTDALLGTRVIRTTHFCVHYSGDQAWATTTAGVLEQVWSAEVDGLQYRHPPYDGDGLFDVTLSDVGSQGYYGACAPAQDAMHSTSSCVLDDDFDPHQFGGAPAINSLRVTAAHEFFHAIQFGYDTTEDTWLMEGTAVWAEDQVYPSINDYLQYLPYSAIPRPRVPVDYKGVTNTDLFFRYGAVLFWKFLSGQFHDPAIIRRVWEYADGSRYSLQAVTAALAERGWTFSRAFARFGVWNTEPVGSYGDRALYPAPAWWQVTSLGRTHRDTGTHDVVLDHLTDAATLIRPAGRLPRTARARIDVNGPSYGRMPAATVQVRRRDGTVRVFDVPLDAAGDGTIRVSFDPRRVAAVVVTLTNASTRMAACWTDSSDRYSCAGRSADDRQVFAVRARLRLRRS